MKLETFYNESNAKKKTRYKIMNATIALLTDNEFAHVTMMDVANACDITQRNLYRYYNNKDLLIVDAIYHKLNSMLNYESYDFQAREDAKAIDILEEIIKRYIHYNSFDESLLNYMKLIMKFDLFLNTLSDDNPAFIRFSKVYIVDFNMQFRDDLRQVLAKGQSDESIRLAPDAVDLTVEYIIHSSSGLLSRILLKQNERDIFSIDLIDMHIDVIIAALRR